MDQNEQNGKKQIALNIVSAKSKHKGFGAGSIDLNNLSPVIIDQGEAKIDIGAMHAKVKWNAASNFQRIVKTSRTDVRYGWYGLLWIVRKKDSCMVEQQHVRCGLTRKPNGDGSCWQTMSTGWIMR